eukprot:CAMPEP_0172691040 /NCGR_PEP_ID=MMETSP1074-20121228/24280_1 /TAXON_ID=2916 /ORGANISM="Ceratium fusus, Strain PA161109" /LENGTH=349 /DNA_ID=CAMNT_0013511053 /DNA_START=270 /DNA_END=1319 /DNA_ORIENTATION=-
MSTMSLHCAEVFGPFFGASIFMRWGPQTVFLTIAGMSCAVQLLLVGVYFSLPASDEDLTVMPSMMHETEVLLARSPKQRRRQEAKKRWKELQNILTSARLWRSVLVVAPAAMIKAALENILPLFADHKLKYNEFEVGLCFTFIAVSFLTTSVIISFIWGLLSDNGQNWFVTLMMIFLGIISSTLLVSYMYGGDCNLLIDDLFDATPDCAPYSRSKRFFYLCLVLFGVASAGCFTPAGYLIGDYIDSLDNAATKDAANGIWNTLWECGGCFGIALSGIPSTRSWVQEQILMANLGMIIIIAASTFFWVSMLADDDDEEESCAMGRHCCLPKELFSFTPGSGGDYTPHFSD